MGVVATAVGAAEIADIAVNLALRLFTALSAAHAAESAGDQTQLNALYAAMKDIAAATEQLPGK